jgi:hypothetical protein
MSSGSAGVSVKAKKKPCANAAQPIPPRSAPVSDPADTPDRKAMSRILMVRQPQTKPSLWQPALPTTARDRLFFIAFEMRLICLARPHKPPRNVANRDEPVPARSMCSIVRSTRGSDLGIAVKALTCCYNIAIESVTLAASVMVLGGQFGYLREPKNKSAIGLLPITA